jgi:hypothetical protein
MNFVVWGHKLHSHTHSYIHYGYAKAFEALGYKVYWLDNQDKIPEVFTKDDIFLTESQVDNNIPLIEGAKYILHHCKLDKYIQSKCRYINLCNYVEPCERGISMNYNDTVIKIKDFLFWDKKNKGLYQPWATDLLPTEIDENNPIMYNSNLMDINYIGTIYHDNIYPKFQAFANSCHSVGKQVKVFKNINFDENKELVKNSYISVDIRGDWHIECGYIPCRIWKNLSYGKLTGTNSFYISKILKDHVIFDSNPTTLFYNVEMKYSSANKESIMETMKYIKENHTYINRSKNIIEFFENREDF